MVDLSIIIITYNTQELTLSCLASILNAKIGVSHEIIVVDNNSSDNTVREIQNFKKSNSRFRIKLILNHENIGFGQANNIGIKQAEGRYVLFLNSDVLIKDVDFIKLISYMDMNQKVGGLTVRVALSNNADDKAAHRGFPTPWRSFCYFTGLEGLFSKVPFFNRYFCGYHLCNKDKRYIHEIDSPSGAFFLARTDVLHNINGFDKDYFMYGEDLDLSYRMKKIGYAIIYYPDFWVLHLKYQSGLKNKNRKIKRSISKHFYEAMRLFYQKHYERQYPRLLNSFIYSLIEFKKNHI